MPGGIQYLAGNKISPIILQQWFSNHCGSLSDWPELSLTRHANLCLMPALFWMANSCLSFKVHARSSVSNIPDKLCDFHPITLHFNQWVSRHCKKDHVAFWLCILGTWHPVWYKEGAKNNKIILKEGLYTFSAIHFSSIFILGNGLSPDPVFLSFYWTVQLFLEFSKTGMITCQKSIRGSGLQVAVCFFQDRASLWIPKLTLNLWSSASAHQFAFLRDKLM